MDLTNLSKISNRTIISLSTLKESQKWLLDILLDRNTLELQSGHFNIPVPKSEDDGGESNTAMMPLPLMLGYHGQASLIYSEILNLLNKLFSFPSGTLSFGIGNRRSRQLSIIRNNQNWISNLFQLSSGESILLNLFLSIIKDFDLSKSNFTELSDINGIVLIDEIDLHLHVHLQKDILPQLIKLFPKIQFVITTHNPMFLLGMQSTFGTNGFEIVEMPSCEPISIENFTEFHDLFSALSETKTYVSAIKAELYKSQLPAVFVEGDYDIKYLKKTIEYFYSEHKLLEQFKFFDGGGFGNLDKIWRSMDSKVVDMLSVKALLLYDCDIKKADSVRGKVIRKTIPTRPDGVIRKGIENLLSNATLAKLESNNARFIDVTAKTTKIIRGEESIIPEQKEVNEDEKRNICDWFCQDGTAEDFEGFKAAVDIIIDFIKRDKEVI